jgi:ribosomal protein L29
MKKKEKEELRDKGVAELRQMKYNLVAELVTSSRVANLKEIRKSIARITTMLRQKELKNETA